MSATNYAACLAQTLEYEGGYSNDPGDPGGPTKYGITIHDVRAYLNPNATAADVKALTLDQAKAIYRKHYWEPIAGDSWPDGLDLTVFDADVNSGSGHAKPWAQDSLGSQLASFQALAYLAAGLSGGKLVDAIKRFNSRRLSFLHSLRTWSLFGRGWGRRVAGIEATSVKMALAVDPAAKAKLEAEARKAKGASGKNVGAGGVSAGGTAWVTQIDWAHLDWATLLAYGAGGAVLFGLTVYCAWWAYHHNARADAYTAAAASI